MLEYRPAVGIILKVLDKVQAFAYVVPFECTDGVLIRLLILQGVFVKKKFLHQDEVGSGQRFTLKRHNLFHLHAVGRRRLRHDGLRHRLFHPTACFLPATAKETQEAY